MCLLLLGVLYIQGSVEQWLVVQRVGSRLGEFGGVVVCRAAMVVLVAVIFRGAENCGVGGEVVRVLQVAFGSTGWSQSGDGGSRAEGSTLVLVLEQRLVLEQVLACGLFWSMCGDCSRI